MDMELTQHYFVSPSLSLCAIRALQQGQQLTHSHGLRTMQAELCQMQILVREAVDSGLHLERGGQCE